MELPNYQQPHWVDLSQIDFESLKKQFENSHKHIEIEKLRGKINAKLARIVRLNRSQMDYYKKPLASGVGLANRVVLT